MNGALKTSLRVVFLAVLIYILAAMFGGAPGFRVRVGKGKRGKCGGNRSWGRVVHPGWRYTGMVGELVATGSMGTAPAGTPVLY
jgi:hypothetical protein